MDYLKNVLLELRYPTYLLYKISCGTQKYSLFCFLGSEQGKPTTERRSGVYGSLLGTRNGTKEIYDY